jgi:beta-lactamase regulating signal transducer with metallopeptidase domain
MKSFIETLNQSGGNFSGFAWPMLWQSSLLIAVLFAFDFLFRRKLRASIRYALWLVILVKLCVPPALALPTSPAWWLHKTPPAVAKSQTHFTVTYDNAPLPQIPPVVLPPFIPSRPAMNLAASLLMISVSISSVLFLWLLARWWQITRQVSRSKTSERLAALADEAQKIVGVKFKVQVKLTTNSMSPAVCGLFRPVILIPQSLVENLSDEQLRAVLLHELIHLQRRDVWVNFLQALLQIFYWWHPLVWLANARIRRVREEAVDDEVMLALRDNAESYAPTLLEVAKLALNRPMASLGLVGILESRHALRQRIERLVDFRPPRKAGLTLVSLLGILAFTAVAVPMGGAPAPVEKQAAIVPEVLGPPAVTPATNQPSVLITSHIYQMRDAEFGKIISGLKFNQADPGDDSWWSASSEKFRDLSENLKSYGLHTISSPRIQTGSGEEADMYVGNGTNGIWFDCTPLIAPKAIGLIISGKVVDASAKISMTNQFSAKASVENFGGIVIRIKSAGGESNLVVVAGVEIVTNNFAQSPITVTFKINGSMSQDKLKKLLQDAGVHIPPTVYFYKRNGIFVVRGSKEQVALVNRAVLKLNGYSPKDLEAEDRRFISQFDATASAKSTATNLFDRMFKVSPIEFIAGLRQQPGLQTNSIAAMAKSFFSALGVDFDLPGKSVFYDDSNGLLFVRATESDLDMVERVVAAFNTSEPQVFIKAQFVAVPSNDIADLAILTNSAVDGMTGILTSDQAKTLLQSFNGKPGFETLGEPEATTLSGKQMSMRATQIINVITNYNYQENDTTNSTITPQSAKVETGPILDTVAYVLSDGFTINLTAIPSFTEFLGYDQPTNPFTAKYTKDGTEVDVPVVLPKFKVRQASANVNLYDGQTLVIGKMRNETSVGGKKADAGQNVQKSELLIFVTVTLVDSAGNRIHNDEELPFAKDRVPPQPAKK